VRSFLIDNQLPGALVRWLNNNGQRASHVLELQLAQIDDAAIWAFAAQHDYAIVTKDEDFAQLSLLRPELVPVIWVRLGNCRTKDLLIAWQNSWAGMAKELEAGARIIEIL